MGYWGWRRILAVFVSVWVVGCTTTHDAAPTALPTESLSITLVAYLSTAPPPTSAPSLPPLTPQPTATPARYTIQPSDTLAEIARSFGVDLEVLQAANADLDPRALPVGHEIVIPGPAFNAAGEPILPTAAPLLLALPPPNCSPLTTGSVVCLGEVINTAAVPVERVTVSVQVIGRDGQILAAAESGLEQRLLLPGSAAPYRVLFHIDWEQFAGAAVTIHTADAAPGAEAWFALPEPRGVQSVYANSAYHVWASIHGAEAVTLRLARAVLTLYDAAGRVTGYRIFPLNADVLPGTDYPLELRIPAPSIPAYHSLLVEAVRLG
ncbi:MAG: LysM peptidoglycan-binding domain-containing protein [Anaerolineae bacterium]|nr:LysM peptidoglycan-binding domain-containing protein [Anaerolineae bacterium]